VGSSGPQGSTDSARSIGVSDRPDPFDGPGAAVDITLKLLAVLALVYVALSALRKYSLGAGLGRSARVLQVVECTNLAANRSLYIVNVEGKRLLIGVTASSMSTLAELEASPDPISHGIG
jgi:flagellar biosynthetic protein FliO